MHALPQGRRAGVSPDPHRSLGLPPRNYGFPQKPPLAGRHLRDYDAPMPTISVFFGLVIQMFWREHAPPHFHAVYAEFEAEIDIRTLEVIRGQLPRRALALVLEWAAVHRNELMEDWELCQAKQSPKKIPPLE